MSFYVKNCQLLFDPPLPYLILFKLNIYLLLLIFFQIYVSGQLKPYSALYLVADYNINYIMMDDIYCSNIISSFLSLLVFNWIVFLFTKYFKDSKLMPEGD